MFGIVLNYLGTRVKSREVRLQFSRKILSQIWGVAIAEQVMPALDRVTANQP